MVLILDGNFNMLRTHGGNRFFRRKDLVTALDLIKCLKQIKKHRLQLIGVSFSEVPSDMSDMSKQKLFFFHAAVVVVYMQPLANWSGTMTATSRPRPSNGSGSTAPSTGVQVPPAVRWYTT